MLQVICRPEATNKEEAYTFHTVHRKRVGNVLQNTHPVREVQRNNCKMLLCFSQVSRVCNA